MKTEKIDIMIEEAQRKVGDPLRRAQGAAGINFTVLELCKEDMKEEFAASPKIQLEIEQFTDDQMRTIAEKLGAVLIEGYFDALRDAVEEVLNK